MKTLDESYEDNELIHEDTIGIKKKSLLATLNREKISKYEMDELFA
jgi:hypothetical protein